MRILLAIDGSASADRALDLVAALPWHDGGRVRIVTVAPCRTDILGVPWSMVVTTDAIEAEEATLRVHRSALEAAERELRSVRGDLVIEPVLLRGRPASVIVDEGREMAADLIVVGHRGHGGWDSALLGSVSAEVVDHATCPVLVARDDRIGPVVLADDGSIHSRAAEATVSGCPLFAGLPITVVSVIDERFPSEVAVAPLLYADAVDAFAHSAATKRRAADLACTAAAERLRSAGLDAVSELRTGDPAHEIIDVARARGAGVIVVGTRGATGLRRLILGSVARNILFHAPCSVLIARGGVRMAPPTVERREDREERELVSPFG
ncbi:MAG: universal stress protein [Chloroflexota bacterium]